MKNTSRSSTLVILWTPLPYRFGPRIPEKRPQVSPSEQLEDDEPRVFVEAHSDEADDVGVVELGHDQRLHQEVHLGLFVTAGVNFSRNLESIIFENLKVPK